MSTEPRSILDVPYEVLTLLATWLDLHDVEYSLRYVCRVFAELADDPYVWARMVCSPCCADEMFRLLAKHPSISIVTRMFAQCEKVAAMNPNQKVLSIGMHAQEFGVSLPSGHGLQLVDLQCQTFAGSLLETASTLESLSIRPLNVPQSVVDLSPCTRLRVLELPNFFEHDLTAIPQLRVLHTSDVAVTPELWESFVASQPSLHALCLDFKGSNPGGSNIVECNMPTSLSSLRLRNYATSIIKWSCDFVAAIVRSSRGTLSVLHIHARVDGSVFRAIAECEQLERIRCLHARQDVAHADIMAIQNLALVEYYIQPDNLPLDVLLAPLGIPRSLYRGQCCREGYFMLGERLRNLCCFELSCCVLDSELAHLIGTHCKRLKQLVLSDVKVPNAIDDIVPALAHVESVHLYSCSDGSNIARAIRDSPINDLSVYTTSSKFINELLVEWTRDSELRWLCDLTFDGCDEETCDILLECGKRERLKAQEMNLTFSTDLEIDDTDVERMQQSLRERLCLCNPHGVTLRVEDLLW